MNEEIKKLSQKLQDDTIKLIQEMVKIPSVRNLDNKKDGAPFGIHIREALDKFIELGNNLNMRTYINPEGFYGYVEIGPENAKEMVGILGHLDVVPQGDVELWNTSGPFSAEIINDAIVGRGVLDDKGPVMINMMAMHIIDKLNVSLTKRIRLIVGTAEETTWEGIDKYIELEEKPVIGYSPDAEFPLINAEKTIAQFDGKAKCNVDFEIESLGAYNAVADAAIYRGNKVKELEEELNKLNYDYKKISNTEIKVVGQGAHAMAVEQGINAICRLCIACYNISERCAVVDFVAEKVQENYGAELIQGKVFDEVSGDLKFNIARILIKDNEQSVGMDSRIPVTFDVQEIMNKYKEVLKNYGLDFVDQGIQDKLFVEEDSFLVSTLLDVYKNVTGENDAKPLSSGGGTYARAFDNCVAFGVVFKSKNMIDKMHQPNECFETKFITPALEIYANAMSKLAK